MDEVLKVSLVQTNTFWENAKANLASLNSKLDQLDKDTDLVLLPEMFSTGFSVGKEGIAEKMDGQTVNWMLEKASEKNCLLVGSVLIEENKKYFNRLIAAFPDGRLLHYDKRHLFSYAGEDKIFAKGTKRLVFSYKGFKVCPLICYDLRFPVWARNDENYDILIYVANWPSPRIKAWDSLLKARAIENLCYTIGLNRVGDDNNKLSYPGHSAVYDPYGECLLSFEEHEEKIKSVLLEKSAVDTVRNKFSFLDDRDDFTINL
ncbi:MAG TPA: nitrilase family protein [Draconibacterium sp.]|nr:nitrilase family protein [Draconibacterium sp.]